MKRVVCTFAVGSVGEKLHELTRPSQRDYAERIGADYVALRGPEPKYKLGPKLRVGELLGRYDRVLSLDADAFVSPDAENMFDVVPEEAFAIHDDLPFLQSTEWLRREQTAICESQEWPLPDQFACLNTGVMLFGRSHAAAFERPSKPYPMFHCSEQHVVTLNLIRHGVPLFRLPRPWNWQWWIDPERRHQEGANVVHWSRPPKTTEAERLRIMTEFAYRGGRPPVCEHRGRQPTIQERRRLGLDTIRDWAKCDVGMNHGHDGFVCPCTGCGPSCDRYSMGGVGPG